MRSLLINSIRLPLRRPASMRPARSLVAPLLLLAPRAALATISSSPTNQTNVYGQPLQPCCFKPLTGFFRTGFCETSEDDHGTHTVCVLITDSFLAHQKSVGNDLSTPRPEFGFPGLKDGDRWCVCALRWKQAMEAGVAGRLMLESTNFRTLEALGMTVEELMKFDAGNGTAGGIGGGKDEL